MKIDIRNLQHKVKIDRKKITRCISQVLKTLGKDTAELSLLFVDDYYIQRLNWKYRKVNSKTDVLAFPMAVGSILGDVVVSTETAKREATKRKIEIQEEIDLYLIHGLLHLVGYDDRKIRDRRRMREKERELLKEVKR